MIRRAGKIVIAALVFGLLASCSWRFNWPEHRVVVRATPDVVDAVERLSATIEMDAGYLVIEEVELVSCVETKALPGFSLAEWLVPSAHAHGVSTPTTFSTPVVVDLLSPGAMIAELEPGSGEYCAIRMLIGPADDDALGVNGTEMVGKSLNIQGRDVATDTRFHLADSRRTEIVFELENIGGPIRLEQDTSRTVEIAINLGMSRWFDDIKIPEKSMDETSADVLANVPRCATGELK